MSGLAWAVVAVWGALALRIVWFQRKLFTLPLLVFTLIMAVFLKGVA